MRNPVRMIILAPADNSSWGRTPGSLLPFRATRLGSRWVACVRVVDRAVILVSSGERWNPDPSSSAGALTELRQRVRDIQGPLSDEQRKDARLSLLGAAGRLSLMRQPNEAATIVPDALRPTTTIEGLRNLDLSLLSGVARDVLDLARTLATAEDSPRLAIAGRLQVELAKRDRVEFVLEGARVLLGRRPQLTPVQEAAILEFEWTLRPELFRLIPLGGARGGVLAWVAPEHRARFWWRTVGADVPETGLDELSGAALVLTRFPDARGELQRLIEVQNYLDRLPGGRSHATVISMADWVARLARSHLKQRVDGERPRLAAAFSAGELELVRSDDCDVSYAEPGHLIVDARRPIREGAVPLLRFGNASVPGARDPGAEERFLFLLPAQITANVAELVLPFEGGDVVVPLGE